MKQCTHCGKQHPDQATVCDVDAMPLAFVPLPEWVGANQKVIAAEHLRLLAISHWICGGLVLGGVPLLWFIFFWRLDWLPKIDPWSRQGVVLAPSVETLNLLVSIYFLVTVILAGLAIVNFISGFNLTRRKQRAFSMRVACLNCLLFPAGTFLGVLTLIVLSRHSVEGLYADRDIQVESRKSH